MEQLSRIGANGYIVKIMWHRRKPVGKQRKQPQPLVSGEIDLLDAKMISLDSPLK
jgi:hypothetical protein